MRLYNTLALVFRLFKLYNRALDVNDFSFYEELSKDFLDNYFNEGSLDDIIETYLTDFLSSSLKRESSVERLANLCKDLDNGFYFSLSLCWYPIKNFIL